MSDLHSMWQGTFKVFGVELKCHVLSDGRRIVEADSIHRLLEAMAEPQNVTPSSDAELTEFARWQRGRGL